MMARVLKTTKRNALIVSVLFFLFYTAFLFWNYYNIDDKPDFKRGTEEDDYRNLQVTIDAGIVADNPQIGEKEAGPLGIFMAADNEKTFNELWLDVERKVSKNRQAEDSKDAPSLIHPMFSHLYVPNADGMFTCLLDGRLVHHSQINDDYCDCLDGTDEPGTSACSDGRFYCKYQSMLKGLMWIKSSRVKDGVCDCPDGSDEPIKSDGGCLDKTEDMRKQEGEHLQLLAKGRRIRKEWIEEVRENVPVLKNELYGRRGEFYKVETSPCLSVKVNKYSYKICPFGESTQESYGSKTVIGRWPRWLKQRGYDIVKSSWQRMSKSEDFVLLSSGGDHSGCPDGNSRESMFVFSCDVQNRVVDISEREKCLYEIDFRTPAAC